MQQVFQQQINYNLHKKIYNQGSGLTFAIAQQPKGCLIKTHLSFSQLQYNYIWKAMLHFCDVTKVRPLRKSFLPA